MMTCVFKKMKKQKMAEKTTVSVDEKAVCFFHVNDLQIKIQKQKKTPQNKQEIFWKKKRRNATFRSKQKI